MVDEYKGQPDREDWTAITGAFASGIASRYTGLAANVMEHITPHLTAHSITKTLGTSTLARQVLDRAIWSQAIGERVGGLSSHLGSSLQTTEIPLQPSRMVLLDRDRATGSSQQSLRPVQYAGPAETHPGPVRKVTSVTGAKPEPHSDEIPTSKPVSAYESDLPASTGFERSQEREEVLTDNTMQAPDEASVSYKGEAVHDYGEETTDDFPETHHDGEETGPEIIPAISTVEQEPVHELPMPQTPEEASIPDSGRSPALSPDEHTESFSPPAVSSKEFPVRESLPSAEKSPSVKDDQGADIKAPISQREENIFPPDTVREGPKVSRAEPPADAGIKRDTAGDMHTPAHRARRKEAGQAGQERESSPSTDTPVSRPLVPEQDAPPKVSARAVPDLAETIREKYTADKDVDHTPATRTPSLASRLFAAISPVIGARFQKAPPDSIDVTETEVSVRKGGVDFSPIQPALPLIPHEIEAEAEPEKSAYMGQELQGGLKQHKATPLSPPGKSMSLIQRSGMTPTPDAGVPRVSGMTKSRELSKQLFRRYYPKRETIPDAEIEPSGSIPPPIPTKPAIAKAAVRKERGKLPLHAGSTDMTYAEARTEEFPDIEDMSLSPAGTDIPVIQRDIYTRETPDEDDRYERPIAIFPARTEEPGGLAATYRPADLVLAGAGARRQKVRGSHEVTTTSIQRAENEDVSSSWEAEETGTEETSENPEHSAESLAREVYAIIKTRLAIERERIGCR